MNWLRLYSSIRHDPKVRSLKPELFQAWVLMLTVANDQKDRGSLPDEAELAFELRLPRPVVARYSAALADLGLLDRSETGALRVHNWDARQFKSDDVSERTRRFKTKTERSGERLGNVPGNDLGTCSDTDTDTDTEAPPTPLAMPPVAASAIQEKPFRETRQPKPPSPELTEVIDAWKAHGLGHVSMNTTSRLRALIAAHGVDLCKEGVERASKQNVSYPIAWMESAIPAWKRERGGGTGEKERKHKFVFIGLDGKEIT